MTESYPSLFLPELLKALLDAGADCYLCVSGGKDSQALATAFSRWFRSQRYAGDLCAIWADLGRSEWRETRAFVSGLCARLDLPLIIVQRERGDLLDRFEERMQKLSGTGVPFWPTQGQRYCTSDLKRTVCDKRFRLSRLAVSLEGIRASESDERAEKEPLTVRRTITGTRYKHLSPDQAISAYLCDGEREASRPRQYSLFDEMTDVTAAQLPRLALTCYPLFDWEIEEVWAVCGASLEELEERRLLYRRGVDQQDAALRERSLAGWPAHPAYVYGANRLSCSLCILADLQTLRAGAYHQPDYYRALVWLEITSGFPFQPSRWLADVCQELLTDEQRAALASLPERQDWLERRKRRKTLAMYPGQAGG